MRTAEFRSTSTAVSGIKNGGRFGSSMPPYSFANRDGLVSFLKEDREGVHHVIENEYHRLTAAERSRIFQLICDAAVDKKNADDYNLLKARFNPGNQYRVKTSFQGKEEVFECFKYEGKFHTGRQLHINQNFITEILLITRPRRQSSN